MPARKMIRFVPNTDQTKVIITAISAECSWPSRFGCQKPRPVWSRRLRRMPCLSGSKKRRATKAITTQETAVGRKKTDRKNRQPRTCVLIRNATPSGNAIATGMASTIAALFSSTVTNCGLLQSLVDAKSSLELLHSGRDVVALDDVVDHRVGRPSLLRGERRHLVRERVRRGIALYVRDPSRRRDDLRRLRAHEEAQEAHCLLRMLR